MLTYNTLIYAHSLREILMDDARLYLVFEFVPMDLKKFIDSRPRKRLDETMTKSFTYQVIILVKRQGINNYLYPVSCSPMIMYIIH